MGSVEVLTLSFVLPDKIVSLTASFDEQLRLLLDPNYQTAAATTTLTTMTTSTAAASRSDDSQQFPDLNRLADLKRNRAKEPLNRLAIHRDPSTADDVTGPRY